MTYPPFKHFTLMEQTPTTASDSATPLQKVFAEVSDMTLPELADYVLELQSQLASKDKQIERLRGALNRQHIISFMEFVYLGHDENWESRPARLENIMNDQKKFNTLINEFIDEMERITTDKTA